MGYSTYSFGDVSVNFSYPQGGSKLSGGQGIGTISVEMTTERTTHDIAADGSIMISKILGNNGSVQIAIQQTSDLNQWLLKWYAYITADGTPTSSWASMTIVIRAPFMKDLITATYVAPQKLPTKPYQSQGQRVTWNLMAANIEQVVS